MHDRPSRARRLQITTDVAGGDEPLTLALLKGHLRIDGTADDTYLGALCLAARAAAENHTGAALARKTVRQSMDCFPFESLGWWDGIRDGAIGGEGPRAISLMRPPLISVTSVTAYDISNAATVMSASDYMVDTSSPYVEGRIVLNYGSVWPAVALRPANGVVIDYIVGYKAPLNLPTDLLQALLMVAAEMYENRGGIADDAVSSSGADRLLARYKVFDL